LHFAIPLLKWVAVPWNLLGLIPLLAGIWFNLVADSAFKKAGTTVKPFQESTTLITDGVFSFSRHPMYLGFELILAGVALLVRSLSPWLVVLIFPLLMERIFIQVEESMLADKFGSAWLEYKNKVRRWI
jgi:protein-S-isoprenylcysteine O-methyltransferase Ste14